MTVGLLVLVGTVGCVAGTEELDAGRCGDFRVPTQEFVGSSTSSSRVFPVFASGCGRYQVTAKVLVENSRVVWVEERRICNACEGDQAIHLLAYEGNSASYAEEYLVSDALPASLAFTDPNASSFVAGCDDACRGHGNAPFSFVPKAVLIAPGATLVSSAYTDVGYFPSARSVDPWGPFTFDLEGSLSGSVFWPQLWPSTEASLDSAAHMLALCRSLGLNYGEWTANSELHDWSAPTLDPFAVQGLGAIKLPEPVKARYLAWIANNSCPF